MDYKIELFRPFRFRTGKGDIKQVEPGTYSIPEDMPDAAGQLAIAQGVANRIVYLAADHPLVEAFEKLAAVPDEPITEIIDFNKLADKLNKEIGKPKRKYTRKKPAPSNKSRSVPENKSALATS